MSTNKCADRLPSRSHGSWGGAKSTKNTNTAGYHQAPRHRTGAFRSPARRILFAFFGICVLLTGHSSQAPAQTDLIIQSSAFIRDLSIRRLAPEHATGMLVTISNQPSDDEVYHELFPAGHATAGTSLGSLQPLSVDPVVEAARNPNGTEQGAELRAAPSVEREPDLPGIGLAGSLWQALARTQAKTGVLLLHLLGLALGLGAATVLDLLVAKSLYGGRLTKEEYQFIAFASKIVCFGLGLLWISGVLFLLHYHHANPAGLENPKVWAKVSIVAILTLNGFYIHKDVLPELKRNAGFSVFHHTPNFKRSMMLASGAVSLVSWYTPLVLGVMSELNFAASAQAILMAYCLVLLLGILGTHLLFGLLTAHESARLPATACPKQQAFEQRPPFTEVSSIRRIRKIDGPFAPLSSDNDISAGQTLHLPSRKAS